MQQQVAKQLDVARGPRRPRCVSWSTGGEALCLTHCVPGPGAARARCHVSLRSAEKMDELRKAFCKACPVSAVAAVAWSDPVVEVGPNHGPSLPEGLRYIRDFVTCSEEAELVAAMDEGGVVNPLDTSSGSSSDWSTTKRATIWPACNQQARRCNRAGLLQTFLGGCCHVSSTLVCFVQASSTKLQQISTPAPLASLLM